MDTKKIIIVVLAVVVVVAIVCGFLFMQNDVKVGDATFNLPEGYVCVANGKYANLTNNHNEYIVLSCKESGSINDLMDNYVENNAKNNLTLTLSNFTVGQHTVQKSVMDNNTEIVHYWFDFNGNAYEIYTRSANSNTDHVIAELINSAKIAII